jgi:DNA replicative helicase MCM subunit Mcm2 (Cdc46/Mcm family)
LEAELVGLVPVKKKVEEIASLLLVDRVRQRLRLETPRPNLHMCFTGDPGTGKTTVALRMAGMLRRLGYLEKGHLVHAMRDDLVGEFIGQTAPTARQSPAAPATPPAAPATPTPPTPAGAAAGACGGSARYSSGLVSSVPSGTLTALKTSVSTTATARLRMIADSPM